MNRFLNETGSSGSPWQAAEEEKRKGYQDLFDAMQRFEMQASASLWPYANAGQDTQPEYLDPDVELGRKLTDLRLPQTPNVMNTAASLPHPPSSLGPNAANRTSAFAPPTAPSEAFSGNAFWEPAPERSRLLAEYAERYPDALNKPNRTRSNFGLTTNLYQTDPYFADVLNGQNSPKWWLAPLPGSDPYGNPRFVTAQPGTPYEEQSFLQAVVTGLGNMDESGKAFASNLWTAVSHPYDTAKALGKAAVGYGSQLAGVECEYRAYADQMTAYLTDRYGSMANFKKAIATDPVGVAGDLSLLCTGLGGVVGVASKGAMLGAKAATAGNVVTKITRSANVGNRVAQGLGKVAYYTDPLTGVEKVAQRLGQSIMGMNPVWMEQAAKIGESVMGSNPTWVQQVAKKGSTLFSRAKTPLGIGGTQQTVNGSNGE